MHSLRVAERRGEMQRGRPADGRLIHRLLEFSPKSGQFQRNRETPLDADLPWCRAHRKPRGRQAGRRPTMRVPAAAVTSPRANGPELCRTDILLLLGGGIAIADAFGATGLAEAVGLALRPVLAEVHPLVMLVIVCTAVTFLTEVTSNTAMTALLLPILVSTSVGLGLDPRLLMLGATLSASCAFMLPIATPPNAMYESRTYCCGVQIHKPYLARIQR